MIRKSFSILFLILSVLTLHAEKTNYLYSFNSDLNEGISQLSVMTIYQDSRGYLWFATKNGLNRFNGKEYKIYHREDGNEQSLSNNSVTSITEDQEGFLWVGTSNGLNRIDLNTNEIKRYNLETNGLVANSISTVYTDRSGCLWVGTWEGLNRYNREGDHFEYIPIEDDTERAMIVTLLEDSSGRFWIGTRNKGLLLCDHQMNLISQFTSESKNMPLNNNNITSIYEDDKKQIWVGCKNSGLNKINLRDNEVTSYTNLNSGLSNNSVRCIIEWQGKLLIGTFDGIFDLDKATERIVKVAGYDDINKSLSHYSVYCFCVDRDETLWVGTFAGGVNYLNMFTNRFILHKPQEELNIRTGIYGAITYESPEDLWIATEGYGLLNYNKRTNESHYYLIDPSVRFAFNTNIIKSVFYEDGYVWCGTTKGEIYKFNIKTKKFSLYHQYPIEYSIYSIIRDHNDVLWVGGASTEFGLTCFVNDSLVTTFYNNVDEPIYFSNVRCILEEEDGVFLLGSTAEGLLRFDTHKKQLTKYSNEASVEKYRIPNNYISAIVRTKSGEIWVSTYGGGIFQLDESKAIRRIMTVREGLLDNNICTLVESSDQRLWMSTVNGLIMFDPAKDEVRNYHRHNGIDIREFTLHSGIALPDGSLCFAGSNGFVTFHVEAMDKNNNIPPVVLEQLSVNNHPVKVGDESAILNKVLDGMETIRLAYNENNFSITYQALNYIYATQNQYAYKLEGYDTDWNYVGERNSAFYTNLSPGKYVFRVKASNNDGVWNEEGRSLAIVVQPPLWRTWYAYLFYVIALAAIIYGILYYVNIKRNLEAGLKMKQLEKQKQEEFHQAKIRLFTNFSHELRTPLMLIITPFEELVKRVDIPAELHDKLSIIYKNAQKLLLLVNQLMDLHKNQAGSMDLKVSEGDICEYIKEIYYAFNQIALTNEVKFTLNCTPKTINGWFDKSLLEKVVFNLLSNAFKYTASGESVLMEVSEVTLKELDPKQTDGLYKDENIHYVILKVKDSGKGIEEGEADKIFTPFYQIPETSGINLSGTGIGLSLVYTIVQLHRGVIYVDHTETKGACFVVILPVSRSAFSEEQIESREIDKIAEITNTEDISVSLPLPEKGDQPKYKILLVEDDKDVRDYLKKSLEAEYIVIEAADGVRAYEKVVQDFPDLVLSDIMMPKRDGLELCTMIKNDIRVGHIPVILMTARSMVVHIKEGFQAGADDYIVKPFNMDVLQTRIRSLLASREQLKKLYGKRFSPDVMGIEVKSADERFSQKLFDVIEKNISNEKLDVELLCTEIGISRANLYRKLKSITELSPMELIRNKRLEMAAKLLKESEMNVSEIASHLGFNSHSYFSNSFKAFYGCTPTEFVQMKNNQEQGG
ncbi:hybrid sensor histidine kinase/response regulator [Parabacteroides sp. AM58-2XD]|uniref:hybrid sensor histidine kinase/response regulator transcription factor n=1 Tax=Parabacteroides TaxID=375288 RepID=UPI000FE1B1DB|nr:MULTISPECIES: hybrid sensor histidine kinase/response regulator transcription factor [Parabacteroides]RGY97542.1 hybrid sensor histidine kinase/response regulator [Parabacteroides sp. AM58-2XD]GKG74117.1 hybrid sensor histidine kinase/response regulator [Parabacteroides goldsteinii]GKG82476.1 hybrid sensor histidine kinase/response regulator [Parabacteroides goldsteinii]